MVTSTNHVIAGLDFIALGPWHFGDFRSIFLGNIGEDPKNFTISARGPLAGTTSYYGKSSPD